MNSCAGDQLSVQSSERRVGNSGDIWWLDGKIAGEKGSMAKTKTGAGDMTVFSLSGTRMKNLIVLFELFYFG